MTYNIESVKRVNGVAVSVVVRWGNITLEIFKSIAGQIHESRTSPAQVYDPNNMDIPSGIYKRLKKQALSILNERR